MLHILTEYGKRAPHGKGLESKDNLYTSPVGNALYQWWCDNKKQVTMKFQEKLILFDKVFMQKPNVLKAEHRKIINK
jgi:hypothetical protein